MVFVALGAYSVTRFGWLWTGVVFGFGLAGIAALLALLGSS